jgi:hypothetical protein
MSKRGQRRSSMNDPLKKLKDGAFRKLLPEKFLHSKLVEFEKLGEESRLLWKDFQGYLASEREKILPDILASLDSSSILDFEFSNYGRIVNSKFSTQPLNSIGSILTPPGGRFNIGQSISYSAYFPSLYIADTFDTAYAEKFNIARGSTTQDGLTGEDLSLAKPESFSYVRVKGLIKKVVDVRQTQPTEAFFNSISSITMPNSYKERAKKLNIAMDVVNSSDWLRNAIYDPNYQQWDYWIDQPSPSQWFGHYVRMAGIHGIIYNSIRNDNGINLALFPENFEGTDSFVELMDQTDFVPEANRRLDGASRYTT